METIKPETTDVSNSDANLKKTGNTEKLSKFYKVIPSGAYNPRPKEPSKRDLWRRDVADRKKTRS